MQRLSAAEKIRMWDDAWRPDKYGASTSYGPSLIRTEDVKDKRVLEIGCGDLFFSYHLDHVGEYIGVDISPNALLRARENFPKGTFVQADASVSLPFTDRSFDTVLAIETITCSGPDAKGILKEAGRVLYSNGELIFDVFHKDLVTTHSKYKPNVELIGELDYGTLLRNRITNNDVITFDEEGIAKLLGSVGLRVENMHVMTDYERSNMGVPIYERTDKPPEGDIKSLMFVVATPE